MSDSDISHSEDENVVEVSIKNTSENVTEEVVRDDAYSDLSANILNANTRRATSQIHLPLSGEDDTIEPTFSCQSNSINQTQQEGEYSGYSEDAAIPSTSSHEPTFNNFGDACRDWSSVAGEEKSVEELGIKNQSFGVKTRANHGQPVPHETNELPTQQGVAGAGTGDQTLHFSWDGHPPRKIQQNRETSRKKNIKRDVARNLLGMRNVPNFNEQRHSSRLGQVPQAITMGDVPEMPSASAGRRMNTNESASSGNECTESRNSIWDVVGNVLGMHNVPNFNEPRHSSCLWQVPQCICIPNDLANLSEPLWRPEISSTSTGRRINAGPSTSSGNNESTESRNSICPSGIHTQRTTNESDQQPAEDDTSSENVQNAEYDVYD